jgi:hypothetical protein
MKQIAQRVMCTSKGHINSQYQGIVNGSGEGVILQKYGSQYEPGRNTSIVKLKEQYQYKVLLLFYFSHPLFLCLSSSFFSDFFLLSLPLLRDHEGLVVANTKDGSVRLKLYVVYLFINGFVIYLFHLFIYLDQMETHLWFHLTTYMSTPVWVKWFRFHMQVLCRKCCQQISKYIE